MRVKSATTASENKESENHKLKFLHQNRIISKQCLTSKYQKKTPNTRTKQIGHHQNNNNQIAPVKTLITNRYQYSKLMKPYDNICKPNPSFQSTTRRGVPNSLDKCDHCKKQGHTRNSCWHLHSQYTAISHEKQRQLPKRCQQQCHIIIRHHNQIYNHKLTTKFVLIPVKQAFAPHT